jgi:hypothetical protein
VGHGDPSLFGARRSEVSSRRRQRRVPGGLQLEAVEEQVGPASRSSSGAGSSGPPPRDGANRGMRGSRADAVAPSSHPNSALFGVDWRRPENKGAIVVDHFIPPKLRSFWRRPEATGEQRSYCSRLLQGHLPSYPPPVTFKATGVDGLSVCSLSFIDHVLECATVLRSNAACVGAARC